MRIRTVAKEGALAALAASKPGVQARERDYELELAKAEVARLSEALKEMAVKLIIVKKASGTEWPNPHWVDATPRPGCSTCSTRPSRPAGRCPGSVTSSNSVGCGHTPLDRSARPRAAGRHGAGRVRRAFKLLNTPSQQLSTSQNTESPATETPTHAGVPLTSAPVTSG